MTKKLTKSAKLMIKGLDKLKGMDFKPKDVKLGFEDELEKLAKTMKNVQKKAMGGEVMDMTKAQPVNMMDGGKIKKMNMGGVVPGRGGKFKGMK